MDIAFHRVKAIVMRNLYQYKHNIMTLIDALYWPLLDIALWGFTSIWMQKSNTSIPNIVLVIMTALVFWEAVSRSTYEISVNMIQEIYSKSLVSLFSTPLTINEWILGAMFTGLLRIACSLLFCISIVWILYALNIFSIGFIIIPFICSLLLFGWATGFFGAGIIMYWGQSVQSLPWMSLFLFAPFSAVYYPLDVMPLWMQYIAQILPTAYIFEGMRAVLLYGQTPYKALVISFCLGIFYLILSLFFFKYMFQKSRNLGLARL